VYEISKQVLPTAPSPTVTHLMNLEALIFLLSNTIQIFHLITPNHSHTLQLFASITHLKSKSTKFHQCNEIGKNAKP